jgi:hypothetical protein
MENEEIKRALDELGPSLDEAVIAALDALRDYRAVLTDLKSDAELGELDIEPSAFDDSIGHCDQLLIELEQWHLNPSLFASLKRGGF